MNLTELEKQSIIETLNQAKSVIKDFKRDYHLAKRGPIQANLEYPEVMQALESLIARINDVQPPTSTKHNGWANYETWAVNLWISNDEHLSIHWIERAKDLVTVNYDRSDAKNDLSQELKDYFDNYNPLADNSDVYTDLLGAALSEVDWYEIAEHLIDDLEDVQPMQSITDTE